MSKALIICGATASGKTSLAVACAKKLNSVVISADSQLVYSDLCIGTAKPTEEEKEGVAHFLIDVVSPFDTFSVSDYEREALPIVQSLLKEEKVPVICGGTGFYINSLLFDLSYGNTAADDTIRKKYEEILANEGKDKLFDFLCQVDEKSASKLHKNDTKRVIRALEIYESSGKKKSEQNDLLTPRFPYVAVAIDHPRDVLYERINLRVEKMFLAGLVQEVKDLLQKGVKKSDQCMQAIGYKEVVQGLEEGWSTDEMIELIQRNTRHYAKRQQTFFKKLPGIIWLEPQDATVEHIMELLK